LRTINSEFCSAFVCDIETFRSGRVDSHDNEFGEDGLAGWSVLSFAVALPSSPLEYFR
jgi:hypothetical protein